MNLLLTNEYYTLVYYVAVNLKVILQNFRFNFKYPIISFLLKNLYEKQTSVFQYCVISMTYIEAIIIVGSCNTFQSGISQPKVFGKYRDEVRLQFVNIDCTQVRTFVLK